MKIDSKRIFLKNITLLDQLWKEVLFLFRFFSIQNIYGTLMHGIKIKEIENAKFDRVQGVAKNYTRVLSSPGCDFFRYPF